MRAARHAVAWVLAVSPTVAFVALLLVSCGARQSIAPDTTGERLKPEAAQVTGPEFAPDLPRAADAYAPAERLTTVAVGVPPVPVVPGPDGTSSPGRCTQYEPLLVEFAPVGGWDVARMSSYMWRESNCYPWARSTTRDTGLLQVNDVNHDYLTRTLGTPVNRETLKDPALNVRAAAALCTYWRNAGSGCYQPWGG